MGMTSVELLIDISPMKKSYSENVITYSYTDTFSANLSMRERWFLYFPHNFPHRSVQVGLLWLASKGLLSFPLHPQADVVLLVWHSFQTPTPPFSIWPPRQVCTGCCTNDLLTSTSLLNSLPCMTRRIKLYLSVHNTCEGRDFYPSHW